MAIGAHLLLSRPLENYLHVFNVIEAGGFGNRRGSDLRVRQDAVFFVSFSPTNASWALEVLIR
jgi:hypothetical protein